MKPVACGICILVVKGVSFFANYRYLEDFVPCSASFVRFCGSVAFGLATVRFVWQVKSGWIVRIPYLVTVAVKIPTLTTTMCIGICVCEHRNLFKQYKIDNFTYLSMVTIVLSHIPPGIQDPFCSACIPFGQSVCQNRIQL